MNNLYFPYALQTVQCTFLALFLITITRIFQVLMLIRNKRISAYMVMSPFGSNNSFLKALIIARHIVVESKVVLVLGLIGLRSIVPPLFFRHLLWSELFSLPVLLSKAHWGVWENATKCQFLEKLTTYFELYLCWRQSSFLIKSCSAHIY